MCGFLTDSPGRGRLHIFMSDIKWIKICTDIFDNEKIRLIEELPEGDTILIIWLKLLTLAGKKNDNGFIYITKDIPYKVDTLAKIMGRKEVTVSLALNTFISFGMVEIEDDIIAISNWAKHQNVEGMDRIKEQNRLRQAKYRQKQIEDNSNVTSRYSNGTDKSRIDKKRIEEDEGFLEFWNLYDKKVGKDKAFKLWEKLSEKDKLSISQNVPLYKAAQPDKKYRKNPETYLRNRSWEDEIISASDLSPQCDDGKGGIRAKISALKEEQAGGLIDNTAEIAKLEAQL